MKNDTRGELNDASIPRRSLHWCQALLFTNKDRQQNNERPRELDSDRWVIWASHDAQANNQGSNELAHLQSLVKAFADRKYTTFVSGGWHHEQSIIPKRQLRYGQDRLQTNPRQHEQEAQNTGKHDSVKVKICVPTLP